MRNWRVWFLRQDLRPRKPNQSRRMFRYPKSPRNPFRKNLLLPLPWKKRVPSQSERTPLRRRQRCRKSICPTNGQPFSKSRATPKRLWKRLPRCRRSPWPDLSVIRNLGTWKSSRLVRNPRSFRRTMYRRSLRSMSLRTLPQFRSSRNTSPKNRQRHTQWANLKKNRRLKLRRNLPRRASPNLSWNRNMNSYWMRSPSSRPTTRGRPRRQLLHPSRSRKTRGQRHLRAAVLLPINSWRILPAKSISSALTDLHQDFRGRCPPPSRRPSRSLRPIPRNLASPAPSRKCSTSFALNSVRWVRRTRISKHTTAWASRFEILVLRTHLTEFSAKLVEHFLE